MRPPAPVAFLVLLLACGDDGPATADAATSGPPPAKVEVGLVRDGDLDEAWTTLGEVIPLARSELAASAAGPVERVPFREGDFVEEGTVLLQVDAGPAAARLQATEASRAQAEAELAQAQSDLARLQTVASRVLAERELEAARTQVATLDARRRAAVAAEQEARVALARHAVRAPFAGVLTARHVDPGDWVSAGTPAVDLVSARAVEVHIDATWELAGRLRAGDEVVVLGNDRADQVAGQVVAVVPALDPITRTSRVRIAPATDPPPDWLRPGAPVEVRFEVAAQGIGVVVPRDALVLAPNSAKVVRVTEGKAEHLDVVVVSTGDAEALVRAAGLNPGDQVVTRGNERVRPGQGLVFGEGG